MACKIMKVGTHTLTLVTNKKDLPTQAYLELIEGCVKAGVSCVQLREKSLNYKELLSFGRSLKELLDSKNIPLIINDHLDLCLDLDASGVHLGQGDGDPVKARSMLGPDKIIGLTVNTMTQVENSNALPIDYIGLGAIFPTKNKPDIENIWGLEGLKKASLSAAHPIIAIGGIDHSNVLSVLNSGAEGVAAIAALHPPADPMLLAQQMRI